jgi:hypothetical protein
MKSYLDKLQELGIETLTEHKDEIKQAMVDSQIEIIKKSPQLLEKLLDAVLSSDGDSDQAAK